MSRERDQDWLRAGSPEERKYRLAGIPYKFWRRAAPTAPPVHLCFARPNGVVVEISSGEQSQWMQVFATNRSVLKYPHLISVTSTPHEDMALEAAFHIQRCVMGQNIRTQAIDVGRVARGIYEPREDAGLVVIYNVGAHLTPDRVVTIRDVLWDRKHLPRIIAAGGLDGPTLFYGTLNMRPTAFFHYQGESDVLEF